MSLGVFLMVLAAALLHAGWNAAVKGGDDKALNMAAVVVGQGGFGALAVLVAPTPALECWPWLLLGAALHLGYNFFLIQAYRSGEFTQVYPIARGSAPILVAAVSVAVLGVALSAAELLAIGLIAAGIVSLALTRRADGLRNGRGAGLALITGGFIAAYSIADGMGARAAGTALGFFGWLAVIEAIAFCGIAAAARPRLLIRLPSAARIIVLGGGASFLAYGLVVHAFTLAPIALVTALRETSIVFALLIGVAFMGERLNLARLAATMATICGAALLRAARP